jgi:hypothetical protein
VKRVLLAVVVAAVVLAAVFYLRGGEEPAQAGLAAATKPATNKSSGAPAPDVVLAIRPGTRPPKASPPPSKLSPLMQELATGYGKPLYDRLSQKNPRTPEETYVLARLLELCTDVIGTPRPPVASNSDEARQRFTASVSEKDPDRAKRLAAFEKMAERRCAGFDGMKTDPRAVKDLIDQAAAAGDPKARVRVVEREVWACCSGGTVRGDTVPTISNEQLQTLQEALRSGDPHVMLVAGSILSSTLGDLMIRAGPDERPIDNRAFNSAFTLAACNAGYDCGPNSGLLLSGCANLGNCGAQNVEEYLYFYSNSPQQSQLINEYRSQLSRAMQSGDWSYFTFVRARPPQGNTWYFRGGW